MLNVLDASTIGSLAELNSLLSDYLMNYNNTHHSAIDMTPIERFEGDLAEVMRASDKDWIDEQFLNRVTRKVRNDMTLALDKVSYDVPAVFMGQKVEVRFMPGDSGSVHIFKDKKKWPLLPTNKIDNYKTKRRSKYSINYTEDLEAEHV